MSDHEERVEHPEVSRARKAVGAEPEGVPNAIVSDLLDRYDAMKAERDAAVKRVAALEVWARLARENFEIIRRSRCEFSGNASSVLASYRLIVDEPGKGEG